MKLTALTQDFQRCGINPTVVTQAFMDHRSLPKRPGLYSIWQGDVCIYVGQGGGLKGIRGRVYPPHHNKAFGTNLHQTRDCVGWANGRTQEWWKPETWTIEYFECERSVYRTYLEGAMMLEFDPYCNDENFLDRQKG